MIAREQLKTEIDHLDDRHPELAFNIICQFPRAAPDKPRTTGESATGRPKRAMGIAQEIADSGGLGIGDPVAWQREVRRDRPLPSRNE
uniref:Uncharacterized protein n=1 Tax=Candidatus Kentrum sp. DK TaxID=2126562 RepID=A0A450T7N6_9GAMM|nr:MAG: hypothetical protein BECKDK2373C_GA0170839_105319 [Candidatus Kentron sp. DK]VFJ62759.1 MAG: hypothetical protein BECKDK2373B_GA0170837_11162 [Candidatus Kentron sp. DK]